MTKNDSCGQRPSDHINRRTTQNLFRGFDFAERSGIPLNTYAVLNLIESSATSAATIFEKVRRKYRNWLQYATRKAADGPRKPAYVYVFENPDGTNPHVNWAVHVPESLKRAFHKKLPGWLQKAQGALGPYDIKCQPITKSFAKRLAKYIVKGTDPLYASHFHLSEMAKPQGRIWGRRASTSPALSTKARKTAGFAPRKGRWTARQSDVGRESPAPSGATAINP